MIDSGCLRRDLRLVLELEGDSHRYQAAPLREVVMPQEVERALAERRERGGALSELLARRLRARQAASVRSIGAEAGLECFQGGPVADDLLPERARRLLRAVPLRREGEALVVAVYDPLDSALLRDLERITGGPVHAVLGDPAALAAALPPAEDEASALEEDPLADSETELLDADDLLLEALEEGAEEVLLEPRPEGGAALRFRVLGELRRERSVPRELAQALAARLAPAPPHGAVARGSVRLEVHGLPISISYRSAQTTFGPSLAMTIEPDELEDEGLSQLGLGLEALATFEQLLAQERGLFVLGAPRAAERSAAYHAILGRALRQGGAVVSLEREVRRTLAATQLQVSAGEDLRGLLEPRPDWVGVDGLLDPAALEVALDMVLGGGAAVVTVPAWDAPTALARLELAGVPRTLLDATLAGVLVRRRVATLCPRCRFERGPGDWIGLGCLACAEQGFAATLPVAELALAGGERATGERIHARLSALVVSGDLPRGAILSRTL
ncbi:MAG TPA: hypothetical protein DEA08_10650 [Planctomycetes bacterium]|nr:hypothetical protein [Planctomycetota bacterium]